MNRPQLLSALIAAVACLASACALSGSPAAGSAWDPNAFKDESTLQFLTVGPDEGEHWSTVWLAVIDNQLYVRLGSTADRRIERNTTAPYVKVRIAGQEFDKVKVEPAPEMADKVAAAMADKYWLDVFVRYMSHPLTARLVVEPSGPQK
jgi:hypothetical protein